MASIDSLRALLVEKLQGLYDVEQRLTKAIPKLAENVNTPELREALNKHLAETRQHVTRLELAFADLGEEVDSKTCSGMKAIINEGDDMAGDDYDEPELRDAAIIGAAQRVEHYEMAAYGTAIAHARTLGRSEIVRQLEPTLAEEKAADKTLTDIAERVVNVGATTGITSTETRPRTSM